MKEKFSEIAFFQYSAEAQIIKSRLEAEGIEVFLSDELTVNVDPLISHALGGIKLKVWAEDEEKSLRILASISEYSLNDRGQELECPICGSEQVELYTSVRSPRAFFAFLLSFFTNTLPIHTKYEYRCDNCKQKFNLE